MNSDTAIYAFMILICVGTIILNLACLSGRGKDTWKKYQEWCSHPHSGPESGTPKTLAAAIRNGAMASKHRRLSLAESTVLAAEIRPAVRDFLSQSFGTEMILADEQTLVTLKRLWKNLTGEAL